MADSAPEPLQSDLSGLRHISSSLFSIPGFIVGLGSKFLSESESVRSPTSPLDFKVLQNLSNPFGLRSPRTQSASGHQKKWDGNKVGFGIIDSLVNETKPPAEVFDSPRRNNVIFGAHVKTNIQNTSKHYIESLNSSLKSNSLPKNYIFSSFPKTSNLYPQLDGTNVDFGENEGGLLESEPTKRITSCLVDSTVPSPLSFMNFCPENKTTPASSSSVISHGSQVASSLGNKPSSLPISIGSNHELVGSLSTKEIELSEDYTCIISHGPNPKTTHIFGDYILDYNAKELANSGKKEESGINSAPVVQIPGDLKSSRSDKIFSFCYSCNKRLEEGEDIYIYRGEKAFCSFECRAEEILSEESEETNIKDAESSPESSYREDLFLMGMPFAT